MFGPKQLFHHHNIASLIICLLVLAALAAPIAVLAQAQYQPIEWGDYQAGKVKFTLSYAGLTKGCKLDQPNNSDQKFWINANASYNPDNYQIFSSDWLVARAFRNKSPMGNLSFRPYICLGLSDTAFAGGPSNVANKLFVWIR